MDTSQTSTRIPTEAPLTGQKRRSKVVEAVLLMVLAIACLVGSVAVIWVELSTRRVGGSVAEGVVFGGALLVGAAVLARAAERAEHRARGHEPIGRRVRADQGISRYKARSYRHSPTSQFIAIVVVGVLAVPMAVLAVVERSEGQRSTYTQHHGVAEVATVESVLPEQHTSKSSTWYTYDYVVSLPTPVIGQAVTTVHDPNQQQEFTEGQAVNVLVDSKDASYAEVPGEADVAGNIWLLFVVFAAMFLGFAVFGFYRFRRRGGFRSPWPPSP
jgi:hypothetical protein